MRARGQGLLTLVLAAALAGAAVASERIGPRVPSPASEGSAPSAAWLCPHGGGKDYEGVVFLANPGEAEVLARVTELRADGPGETRNVTVPARGQVAVTVPARARADSTFVETFGSWIAAGWLVRGAEGEAGVAAEPCAPDASRSWYSAAATTGRGDASFLVVMNPFAVHAVFDVALFAADRAPVRHADLTDITLGPQRSLAVRLNAFAQGEAALGVSVDVSSGRVAASTTVVSDTDGIASVLGSPASSDRIMLLTSRGAGQSDLGVMVASPNGDAADATALAPSGELGTTFSATLRSRDAAQPAGGLTEQAQEPGSAAVYPVVTTTASAVDVAVREGAPVVAALRTVGVGRDWGATGGSVAAAESWVVMPTIAGEPAKPGVLALNPGERAATVVVESLPVDGTGIETTLMVAPGAVGVVPRTFLTRAGPASIVLRSEGAPIVALGASTSLGNEGLSLFGLASGVPIPVAKAP
jgi:hypothetical protein